MPGHVRTPAAFPPHRGCIYWKSIYYNMNHRYHSPAVLQVREVCLEERLLDASLTPALTVESVGQEVEVKDYASGNFNFEWE